MQINKEQTEVSISNIREIVSMFDIEHPLGKMGAIHHLKEKFGVSSEKALEMLNSLFV